MKPNYFMSCVTDIKRSVAFYNELFDMTPLMETPQFVPYIIDGGITFALWSHKADLVKQNPPRISEVGLSVASNDDVDAYWETWQTKGEVIEELHEAPFGHTFVIADPDGNHIRVAPVD